MRRFRWWYFWVGTTDQWWPLGGQERSKKKKLDLICHIAYHSIGIFLLNAKMIFKLIGNNFSTRSFEVKRFEARSRRKIRGIEHIDFDQDREILSSQPERTRNFGDLFAPNFSPNIRMDFFAPGSFWKIQNSCKTKIKKRKKRFIYKIEKSWKSEKNKIQVKLNQVTREREREREYKNSISLESWHVNIFFSYVYMNIL